MSSRDPIDVPRDYPTATIFIDESGSKSDADFFVVAGVKTRRPGQLARAIHGVRERHALYKQELKFSGITSGSVQVYTDIIAELEASDAHIAACVVDGSVYNPFKRRGEKRAAWQVHAEVVSQLLVGCINKRELVGVLMDGISTPPGCSLDDTVRELVNDRLGSTAVVSSACLDSKSNDLLQVADLVAGAVLHERRRKAQGDPPRSHKGRVAMRLAYAFDRPGLTDGRAGRVNIRTYRRASGTRRPTLKVVGHPPQAS